jgi:hypothetical protein
MDIWNKVTTLLNGSNEPSQLSVTPETTEQTQQIVADEIRLDFATVTNEARLDIVTPPSESGPEPISTMQVIDHRQIYVAQPPPPQLVVQPQQEQYANHQIERPEIAIPCFKNLPVEVLHELIRDGQMFSPDIFVENYESLPDELKSKYTYEPVQMIIDEVPEVLAYRMIRRYADNEEDDDEDDDEE